MHIRIDSPIILMETVPSFLMWPQVSRWPVTTNQHKASNFFKFKFSFIQSPLFLFLIFFQFPQLQWIMQNVTVPRFPCILASFGKAGKKKLTLRKDLLWNTCPTPTSMNYSLIHWIFVTHFWYTTSRVSFHFQVVLVGLWLSTWCVLLFTFKYTTTTSCVPLVTNTAAHLLNV